MQDYRSSPWPYVNAAVIALTLLLAMCSGSFRPDDATSAAMPAPTQSMPALATGAP